MQKKMINWKLPPLHPSETYGETTTEMMDVVDDCLLNQCVRNYARNNSCQDMVLTKRRIKNNILTGLISYVIHVICDF